MSDHAEFTRKELFDVVMLKNGVNDMSALSTDFKRIPVEAGAPFEALTHKDVTNVTGYHPLFAVPPGVATEPEVHARRRELEGPLVDKSKI